VALVVPDANWADNTPADVLATQITDNILTAFADPEPLDVYGGYGTVDPVCGDGIMQGSPEEECDDGNTAPCDGCSPTCVIVPDWDDDGIDDSCDNCSLRYNPAQIDTDADGCGNQCDADFTQDGTVGAGDFFEFAGAYGSLVPPASPNIDIGPDPLDGAIGAADFFILATSYGGAPGPSGTTSGTTACP
jgi:cysteine-rich repeat protein